MYISPIVLGTELVIFNTHCEFNICSRRTTIYLYINETVHYALANILQHSKVIEKIPKIHVCELHI